MGCQGVDPKSSDDAGIQALKVKDGHIAVESGRALEDQAAGCRVSEGSRLGIGVGRITAPVQQRQI